MIATKRLLKLSNEDDGLMMFDLFLATTALASNSSLLKEEKKKNGIHIINQKKEDE